VALGATFYEWMNVDQGQVTNASFLDYQLPSLKDVPPELIAATVEVPHPDGPFGAKGVGESAALSVQAAIGNAVYNAVGVRVKDLPITPEKVLRALHDRAPEHGPPDLAPPAHQQPPASENVGATDVP
jgi:CO/xanthine dehydrogenase Mo-binding subunit